MMCLLCCKWCSFFSAFCRTPREYLNWCRLLAMGRMDKSIRFGLLFILWFLLMVISIKPCFLKQKWALLELDSVAPAAAWFVCLSPSAVPFLPAFTSCRRSDGCWVCYSLCPSSSVLWLFFSSSKLLDRQNWNWRWLNLAWAVWEPCTRCCSTVLQHRGVK